MGKVFSQPIGEEKVDAMSLNIWLIVKSILRSFFITFLFSLIAWAGLAIFGQLKIPFIGFFKYLYFEKGWLVVLVTILVDSTFYVTGINKNKYFKRMMSEEKLTLALLGGFSLSLLLMAILL